MIYQPSIAQQCYNALLLFFITHPFGIKLNDTVIMAVLVMLYLFLYV